MMKKYILPFFICLSALMAYGQDPWKITVNNPLDSPYYGETVANGILGLKSSQMPLVNDVVILANTYDIHPKYHIDTYFENIRFLNLGLSVDGNEVSTDDFTGYTQTLDMQNACLSSRFIVRDKAEVEIRQYALRQLPYNALSEVCIRPLRDVQVAVANRPSIPANLGDVHFSYQKMTKKRGNIYLLSVEAKGLKDELKVVSSTSFVFDNNVYPEVRYDSIACATTFNVHLEKGADYHFALVGSLISTCQTPNPRNEADRLTILATLSGRQNLVGEHINRWKSLWKSDITIEGDAAAQQDIHSMLYHLYSNVRADSHLSIPPMGVTGLTYHGHIFWDADLWMMPALLLLHPELAKSLIDFRIDHLDSARFNAFEHGYRGAMYPWESSDSGFEDTQTGVLTGIFEHHITGCVALAAWQYYCVTGDTAWLKERGYPVIHAAADFWVSRTVTDDDGNRHIRNVCCADEYATKVDDNAFTNAVAMATAQVALKAAGIIGAKPNESWTRLIGALPIHKMDNGVTSEYDGYNGEKIKQADVNLLAYPLNTITDREQILRDLQYYAAKVPLKNTPAMTESIFALLYARLGNADKAGDYFTKSYRENKLPPFGVLAECKGGNNPYFLTCAGGVLQAVIMGFAGYNITDSGVRKLVSAKPRGWKKIEVKLGQDVRVVSSSPCEAGCVPNGN